MMMVMIMINMMMVAQDEHPVKVLPDNDEDDHYGDHDNDDDQYDDSCLTKEQYGVSSFESQQAAILSLFTENNDDCHDENSNVGGGGERGC